MNDLDKLFINGVLLNVNGLLFAHCKYIHVFYQKPKKNIDVLECILLINLKKTPHTYYV